MHQNLFMGTSQIPRGLPVNPWLIEPSTFCKVPDIFEMYVVKLVISESDKSSPG